MPRKISLLFNNLAFYRRNQSVKQDCPEIGQRFGDLTVLSRAGSDAAGRVLLHCRCECRNECDVRRSDLRSKHTKSCGCLRVRAIRWRFGKIMFRKYRFGRVLGKAKEEHGVKPSSEWVVVCNYCPQVFIATTKQLREATKFCDCMVPTRNSWRDMIQRCTNKNHPQYKDYGGNGVKICDRWRKSFAAFVEDMRRRPKGTTIHRRPGGSYTRNDCSWENAKVQAQYRRKPAKRKQ